MSLDVIRYAQGEIARRFGHQVVIYGSEPINKFGRNGDIDSSVSEDIWATGGTEVLPTDNTINELVSSDAGDVGSEYVLIGRTLDSGDFTRFTQTVTSNGTTPVTLGTPLARLERGFVDNGIRADGTVTIGVSGGATHMTIRPQVQQSEKCAFNVPVGEYGIIWRAYAGVLGSNQADIDFAFMVREDGGVWRERGEVPARAQGTSFADVDVEPPLIVPPNSDVKVVGDSDVNNATGTAMLYGTYARIKT